MAYWRIQLHPDEIGQGATYADNCLRRGYIGLDFRNPDQIGDLSVSHSGIEKGQRTYRFLQSEMRVGDLVLVQVGFDPFALVEVAGEYEYDPEKKGGEVWFRHMRGIKNVRYYEDFVRASEPRERIFFRSTLMRARNPEKPAYRLIERWRNAV